MNNVNKTLYIPLYGKAYVSRKGLFLKDTKAEEIWTAEAFPLKGKSKSKWLAYNMGMRSAVFDRWLVGELKQNPQAVVLHLGCGMDSRALRVQQGKLWFDVDFPEVIAERQRYYAPTESYQMIGADIREESWLEAVPRGGKAILVMEGVSMYLQPEELKRVLKRLSDHFDSLTILLDSYTVFAAKATRYKNPINDVGVTQVYGIDDPRELEEGTGLRFVAEHDMVPETLIQELKGFEQTFFRKMFAGKLAKKIYRLYEYIGN